MIIIELVHQCIAHQILQKIIKYTSMCEPQGPDLTRSLIRLELGQGRNKSFLYTPRQIPNAQVETTLAPFMFSS